MEKNEFAFFHFLIISNSFQDSVKRLTIAIHSAQLKLTTEAQVKAEKMILNI